MNILTIFILNSFVFCGSITGNPFMGATTFYETLLPSNTYTFMNQTEENDQLSGNFPSQTFESMNDVDLYGFDDLEHPTTDFLINGDADCIDNNTSDDPNKHLSMLYESNKTNFLLMNTSSSQENLTIPTELFNENIPELPSQFRDDTNSVSQSELPKRDTYSLMPEFTGPNSQLFKLVNDDSNISPNLSTEYLFKSFLKDILENIKRHQNSKSTWYINSRNSQSLQSCSLFLNLVKLPAKLLFFRGPLFRFSQIFDTRKLKGSFGNLKVQAVKIKCMKELSKHHLNSNFDYLDLHPRFFIDFIDTFLVFISKQEESCENKDEKDDDDQIILFRPVITNNNENPILKSLLLAPLENNIQHPSNLNYDCIFDLIKYIVGSRFSPKRLAYIFHSIFITIDNILNFYNQHLKEYNQYIAKIKCPFNHKHSIFINFENLKQDPNYLAYLIFDWLLYFTSDTWKSQLDKIENIHYLISKVPILIFLALNEPHVGLSILSNDKVMLDWSNYLEQLFQSEDFYSLIPKFINFFDNPDNWTRFLSRRLQNGLRYKEKHYKDLEPLINIVESYLILFYEIGQTSLHQIINRECN